MTTGANRQRQHYWDSTRGLLMLLGIPYHAAMPYRAGQQWIVTAPAGGDFYTLLSNAIHVFRMPAFFVVAGYFVALMLARRDPRLWLKSRLLRLGVPLAASLVVLIPLLNIACELSNYPLPQALSSFAWQSSHSGGYWVRHLWFIIVLLYFSAAGAALVSCSPALAQAELPVALDARIARSLSLWLLGAAAAIGLWEALAIEGFYKAGMDTNLLQQILRLDEVLTYAPFFAAGVILHRAPRTLAAVTTPSLAIGALGAVALVATLLLEPNAHPAITRFVSSIAAIGIAQVILATARTWFDRPSRHVDALVRASFVIYLVHMPIVVALTDLAVRTHAPLVLQFAGVATGTFALSYAIWLVVDRVALLRFLFDGRGIVAETPARPVATARALRSA